MLNVSQLSKTYDGQAVLQDIHLQLPAHTTLCILGKSGGGKTTLLKCLAGLESPDSGEIWFGGENLTHTPAHLREMVYLYQEPLLFPHLNVLDNIGFGLKVRGVATTTIREKAMAYVSELGLEGHENKRPDQLSGGQMQRVAFGRALIIEPRVLLLDEPFGKLDAQTRGRMQALFVQVAQKHRITSLFVTHDVKEALLMGDTFGRLEEGRLDLYPDRQSFIADPRNGVKREVDFWGGLGK